MGQFVAGKIRVVYGTKKAADGWTPRVAQDGAQPIEEAKAYKHNASAWRRAKALAKSMWIRLMMRAMIDKPADLSGIKKIILAPGLIPDLQPLPY